MQSLAALKHTHSFTSILIHPALLSLSLSFSCYSWMDLQGDEAEDEDEAQFLSWMCVWWLAGRLLGSDDLFMSAFFLSGTRFYVFKVAVLHKTHA